MENLNLDKLAEIGAFVPDELVKKEIKFRLFDGGDEYTAVIHVRRMGVGAYERINLGLEPDRDSRLAKLISSAVRLGESGEQEIPYAKAYELNRRLAGAMLVAIGQVNGGARKN